MYCDINYLQHVPLFIVIRTKGIWGANSNVVKVKLCKRNYSGIPPSKVVIEAYWLGSGKVKIWITSFANSVNEINGRIMQERNFL